MKVKDLINVVGCTVYVHSFNGGLVYTGSLFDAPADVLESELKGMNGHSDGLSVALYIS